ncbi:ATP-dependent nuclease [Haloarcula sp. AONF1]
MKINKFKISGYKSIDSEQEVTFDGFNVLLGENNTGKSSIIEALRDYQDIFPVAGGVNSEWAHTRNTGKYREGEIRFVLETTLDDEEYDEFFQAIEDNAVVENSELERWKESNYLREIRHELKIYSFPNPNEPVTGESEMLTNFDGEEIYLRKGTLSESRSEYLKLRKINSDEMSNDRQDYWIELKEIMRRSIDSWEFVDAFRQPEPEMDAQRELDLGSDGKNLSQVLLTLSGESGNQFQTISDEYAKVMSGVSGIRTPLPEENQTTVVVDEEAYDYGFNLSEISAGSKEVLTLITRIVMSDEATDLFLIEEPELHLHPGAQREIFDLIQKELVGRGPQVIVSTHSSVFVNHIDVDSIHRVERDVETSLYRTDSSEVGADLRELGYEYAGMLQSDAVVIVEGLTDMVALKSIGKKYGLDFEEAKIGVVEMGGSSKLVNHSRSLVKLLGVFNIPFMFICDSDLDDELRDDSMEKTVPETPDEIRGRLIGKINGTNGDEEPNRIGWDKVGNEEVYVWEKEELEAYLLEDKQAIVDTFPGLDQEEVEEILDGNDELDPDEQLEKICARARPELDMEDIDPMVKKTDVSDLSGAVDLENLPEEFHYVMNNIASLVGSEHKVEQNRPDGG